jgi:hypothetical protein
MPEFEYGYGRHQNMGVGAHNRGLRKYAGSVIGQMSGKVVPFPVVAPQLIISVGF